MWVPLWYNTVVQTFAGSLHKHRKTKNQERAKIMNILFCGDSNITDGVLISTLSILRSVSSPLSVYILTAHCENENRVFKAIPPEFGDTLDGLLKRTNPESRAEIIDITELFRENLPAANMNTRFTPCCMIRLYADLVEKLPDKILYIDNDVVCRSDFSDFYNQDMGDYELAGVLDRYGKWFFRCGSFSMNYLNSGVLLMNLKKIRETGLFRECRKRCRDKRMFMPDQTAINKLASAKKIIPRRFNEQKKIKNDTVFQHFTTKFRFWPFVHTVTVKPWQIDKMHDVLGIYEYDDLLEEYQNLKTEDL